MPKEEILRIVKIKTIAEENDLGSYVGSLTSPLVPGDLAIIQLGAGDTIPKTRFVPRENHLFLTGYLAAYFADRSHLATAPDKNEKIKLYAGTRNMQSVETISGIEYGCVDKKYIQRLFMLIDVFSSRRADLRFTANYFIYY